MSLTLGGIITAVRGLHPAFDRSRVPDTVLASFLSDYQNTLIGLAVLREKTYVSQSIAIAIEGAATFAENEDLLIDLTAAGVPFTSEVGGFFVQLNENGVPFLSTAAPVTIATDKGTDLPIVLAVIGGTVRYNAGAGTEKLCITDYGSRFNPPYFPAVYFVDQRLHLCGTFEEWNGVASIELRVTPFAPALTKLTDYFLVLDGARQCLVSQAAAIAAERAAAYAQGAKNPTPDVAAFYARAAREEERYLSTLRISRRAKHTTMRDGYEEMV